jgi:hypothetical protein
MDCARPESALKRSGAVSDATLPRPPRAASAATRPLRQGALATLCALALLGAPTALAGGGYTTKHAHGSIAVPPGRTRTLNVPYPDALEYAGATYSGRAAVLAPARGAKGSAPKLGKVKILEAGSVLGGSEYQARAHNGNAPGTAAVTLSVTATTREPRVEHAAAAGG